MLYGMTKRELIEALAPYPNDMEVAIHTEWEGRESLPIRRVYARLTETADDEIQGRHHIRLTYVERRGHDDD